MMAEVLPTVLTGLAVLFVAILIWKAPILTDEDMDWIKKNDPWFKDEE